MATLWHCQLKEELQLQSIGGELKKFNNISLKGEGAALF